ncbi:MAG TPA: universal stress protein [Planctomycetota bacterium]|nr:universal stress protein [Planctomycetota bacterium]
MFRNLLLTTDFSEVARSAYRPALDLARGLGASLRLVHVLEPLPPHYYVSLEGGGVSLPMADYAVEVKKRLESEASHEAFDGAEIPTELVVDAVPVEGVLELIRKHDVDLVCTASHGYGALRRVFLGSFAEKLVRVSPVPVWTFHTKEDGAARFPSDSKDILIPTDFSERSTAVVPIARTLAERFGARLTLMHAIEPELSYPAFWGETGFSGIPMRHPEEVRREIEKRLERFRNEHFASLEVKTAVRHGVPDYEVAQLAKEGRFGLVLLSTHGWTGWKHLLLGSVAERIVRTAPCSVLTVRPLKVGDAENAPSSASA